MKITREKDSPTPTTRHWLVEAKEDRKSVCIDVFSDDEEWGKAIESALHKALKKLLKEEEEDV